MKYVTRSERFLLFVAKMLIFPPLLSVWPSAAVWSTVLVFSSQSSRCVVISEVCFLFQERLGAWPHCFTTPSWTRLKVRAAFYSANSQSCKIRIVATISRWSCARWTDLQVARPGRPCARAGRNLAAWHIDFHSCPNMSVEGHWSEPSRAAVGGDAAVWAAL